MLRRVGFGVLWAIPAYLLGAFGGGFLVSLLSSNTHDRSVEAAMTGAFVFGPLTGLIGFIVGLVARAVKPGDDSAGFIVTTLIGVAGSLIVTYVGQAMGWYTAGQGAGFIASVLGAIVLLVLYGLIKRKS